MTTELYNDPVFGTVYKVDAFEHPAKPNFFEIIPFCHEDDLVSLIRSHGKSAYAEINEEGQRVIVTDASPRLVARWAKRALWLRAME